MSTPAELSYALKLGNHFNYMFQFIFCIVATKAFLYKVISSIKNRLFAHSFRFSSIFFNSNSSIDSTSYSYLPTPLLGQDMTHGQFLSGV